jgi:hypothetical protein
VAELQPDHLLNHQRFRTSLFLPEHAESARTRCTKGGYGRGDGAYRLLKNSIRGGRSKLARNGIFKFPWRTMAESMVSQSGMRASVPVPG